MKLEDFGLTRDPSIKLKDKYTNVEFTLGEVRGIVMKEIMLKGQPEQFAERFEEVENL